MALVLLAGPSLSAGAQNPKPASPYQQVAAQQIKKMPTGWTGPTHLIGGFQKNTATTGGATAAHGCHDGASQTSYEGSCDNHPEYEATGGCESEATGTSTPGNCPNSSEP